MTQQMNDIEETAIDVLSHQDCEVLSLRPFSLFVVPIFNRSNYVCLVSLTKHHLDSVHRIVFWILE